MEPVPVAIVVWFNPEMKTAGQQPVVNATEKNEDHSRRIGLRIRIHEFMEQPLEHLDVKTSREEPQAVTSIAPSWRIEQMWPAVKKNLSRKILAMLNSCVDCGLCAEACHYYSSTGETGLIPANKVKILSNMLRIYFHPLKSHLPFLKRKDLPDERMIEELFKVAYEHCTLCGKCSLDCPMGIDTGQILYLARAMLFSIDRIPSGLKQPVENVFKMGNYLGLSPEDFIENMEWIAEEMGDDIGEDHFSIPMDKKHAEVLYVPHPLEARDLPLLIMDAVKILHAAGEDYTLSSYGFDTVNYAYYQGSKENMMRIAQRLLDAREKLQARSIVLAPCGHGYRVMRWEVEKYQRRSFISPSVRTLVELIDHYIQQGRLRLEKDVFEGPITYHDPCNIARRGGVLQAPRNVLRTLTSGFVEMHPNGARNYCCGGGGGLAATGDYGKLRATMGMKKVEQIRQTGAKIVVTNCFNCMTQIQNLRKVYDLDVKVLSIVELVAGSLRF